MPISIEEAKNSVWALEQFFKEQYPLSNPVKFSAYSKTIKNPADPASDKQRSLIVDFLIENPQESFIILPNTTKQEASDYIDKHIPKDFIQKRIAKLYPRKA